MHDKRDQDVHVALNRVAKSPVTSGNNDLKKIGADREMGWNSQDIDHRGHANVTGATPEKSAAQSAYERDQQNDPERDGNARLRERNHRRNAPALNCFRHMLKRRFVGFTAARDRCSLRILSLREGERFPTFPHHEAGDAEIDDDGDNADDKVDASSAL